MTPDKDTFQYPANLNGTGLRLAIVVARFNNAIGEGLLAACAAELERLGVKRADIHVATVPGALEIPFALQKLACTEKFDALVALGAVIRGETYHFEVVSNESAAGVMSVQLHTGVPVANGILTTNTDEQAAARVTEKGADCARAAVEMANLVKLIDEKQ